MIQFKHIALILLLIPSGNLFGQDQFEYIESHQAFIDTDDSLSPSSTSINTTFAKPVVLVEPIQGFPLKKRDFKKLGINTTVYLYAGAVAFGVLWAAPESFSSWDKQEIKQQGFFHKWNQNVAAGPVIDQDDFPINYVAHPYCGAIYYTTARSCGFKWYESFGYSFLMSSLFWEYGIEAFAEIPSQQDLIITPVIGSMIGETFFIAKKKIMRKNKRLLNSKVLGITVLFLMDPINTIVDGCGYKQKVTTTFTIAPVKTDLKYSEPVLGFNLTAKF